MSLVGMEKEEFVNGFNKLLKENYTKEEMKAMYERLAKENSGKREEFKARLTKRIEDKKSLK
jgi:endonuclease IV